MLEKIIKFMARMDEWNRELPERLFLLIADYFFKGHRELAAMVLMLVLIVGVIGIKLISEAVKRRRTR